MVRRKRVSGDQQRTPETLRRSFRLRRNGGFRPALTPDSLQYEQTGPLPFT